MWIPARGGRTHPAWHFQIDGFAGLVVALLE
jgi:hypothetical protein